MLITELIALSQWVHDIGLQQILKNLKKISNFHLKLRKLRVNRNEEGFVNTEID